jgi:hypothetical protein
VTKAYSPSPEDIDVYPEEINDPWAEKVAAALMLFSPAWKWKWADDISKLMESQLKNLKRFMKKIPSNSKDNISISIDNRWNATFNAVSP